jgi:uncharacterized protein YjbI with pentapeptide repeats
MKTIKLARKGHPEIDEARVAMLLHILERGAAEWNRWREENPDEYIDLRQVNLFGRDLSLRGANLAGANLSRAYLPQVDLRDTDLSAVHASAADFQGAYLDGANLQGAYLPECNFSFTRLMRADLRLTHLVGASLGVANCEGANLRKADLSSVDASNGTFTNAILAQANLTNAILREADLSNANLSDANLNGASLVETNLQGANLNRCKVFGTSVWKTNLRDAQQVDLVITDEREAVITVDNLKVAQFIYLILNNEEIRDVIDTVNSKAVLILGRFTPERKLVLDGLRITLRNLGYIPILFDFDKPAIPNLTETVSTLSHLARFVIADITDAKSIPQELQRIVPDRPSLPVQPVILSSEYEWAMFESFRDYPWVLLPYRYDSTETLLASLEEKVIAPAEAKVREIEGRRRAFEKMMGSGKG